MKSSLFPKLMFPIVFGASTLLTAGYSSAETMTVYKSPSCGCCAGWVKHMEEAGFDVEVHNVDNVNPIKEQAGLHPELASCHTAMVENYVFEGHVPAADIRQFLKQKPDAKGLAVPGMPAGENVPGMEVPGRRASYASYLIPNSEELGQPAVFAVHE
ncbi:DUF411 domain-containing protein [Hahella ganghwensis]|uniref:DUF411 domain-containing protein n=1 Tax=Hahella ganghwensis TaxID=286420 RepID=UPI000370E757|nr:DUF411 domain-containing protein [Hahella ganghwensis]